MLSCPCRKGGSTDAERASASYDRATDPARVIGLSDGIFAVAITLLVLEIHVPDLSRGQRLADAMREIRPSFVAFLVSFVVVAIAWAGHRDIFGQIRRADRPLVWLNVIYMLPLSLLPFGAALLARYDREPVALRIYGLNLIVIAVTRLAVVLYVTARPHLLYDPIDARSRRGAVLLVVAPAAIYLIGVLIAGVAPIACLVIYAAVPALYFVIITFLRASAPPGAAEQSFT